MKKANGAKRPAHKPQENENIQPALVNSAVAAAGDPLPIGNREEAMSSIRDQITEYNAGDVSNDQRFYAGRFLREFDARSRAMPFVRFVANGEDLPTEVGNVDKLQAPDGSGTWYMFPTSENLAKAFSGEPEDATQGQEAQGGPLHSITGRGEKYAGGNVETDTVAEHSQNPQWEGKGSQTGGTGVQRAALHDGSAIGAAVEDPNVSNIPDQHPDQAPGKEAEDPSEDEVTRHKFAEGHVRALPGDARIKQTVKGKAHKDEPGLIITHDQERLRNYPDQFEVVRPEGKAPKTNEKKVEGAKPTNVDTTVADGMKEGEKTSTDAAAAGAVTAGNSTSDIEQKSPGVAGGFDGKQSEDASEGTAKDTQQPTIDPADKPFDEDADMTEVHAYLKKANIHTTTGAQNTDLIALANGHKATAGSKPAVQKSDEATPQTAGGVLAGGSNAKKGDAAKEIAKKAKPAGSKVLHIGGKKPTETK